MVKNLLAMQETLVPSWVRMIPWRREWQPTLVFLPGKFQGQRSSVGYTIGLERVRHTETHTHTHTLNPVKSRGIKLKDGSRSLGAPGGPSHSTWGDV